MACRRRSCASLPRRRTSATEVADLRARVDAMSRALCETFAVTGHALPAAAGQNVPARPALTLHQGGAA